MPFILDADTVIKLHQADILSHAVMVLDCIITQAVFEEVVTQGKANLHQDANAIEEIVTESVRVIVAPAQQVSDHRLGVGEISILNLLPYEKNATVVTDDQQFLNWLTVHGIPVLTPANLIVLLAKQRILQISHAQEALDRLKPIIRPAVYRLAKQDIERLEGP